MGDPAERFEPNRGPGAHAGLWPRCGGGLTRTRSGSISYQWDDEDGPALATLARDVTSFHPPLQPFFDKSWRPSSIEPCRVQANLVISDAGVAVGSPPAQSRPPDRTTEALATSPDRESDRSTHRDSPPFPHR